MASKNILSVLFVINLFISCKEILCQTSNPGAAKIVLSKQGLEYAANQAVEILARIVPQTAIENVNGKADVSIGRVEYEITETRITSFTKPSASVAMNPGQGMTMSLNEGGISANGDWRYKYKKSFIRLSDSGSFSASASGISINVAVTLGLNGNGAPTLYTTSCHCSIGDINFRLHGGASWLYNIFLGFYKDEIRRSLERILCNEAQNALNRNGAREMATLNLEASINDLLILNYRLTGAPIFGDNFMESNHVGRFLNDDVTDNATPDMQASAERMISTYISEVTFNSLSSVLYKNNKIYFEQTFPTSMFAETASIILDGAEVQFNASGIGLSVGVPAAPVVSIRPEGISVNSELETKLDMLNSEGARETAITIKMSINFQMLVTIRDSKIVGSVSQFLPTLTYCSLSIIDLDKLNEMMTSVANLLVPSIDHALDQGIPLPNVEGVQFYDAVIHLNERFLTVAANAVYHG